MEIKALFLDFDGVLSDNNVTTDSTGNESVTTSKYDSQGLSRFRKLYPEFPIVVITSEENESVFRRCNKLKLPVVKSKNNKAEDIKKLVIKHNINLNNVAFCGNDINDIEGLNIVGLPIVVADASKEVKDLAKIITINKGGNGAVREILDLFINLDFKFIKSTSIQFPIKKNMGFRNWGIEDLLIHSKGKYTLKRLIINKGSRGGIQYHRFKDEAGILLRGKLEIRYTEDNKNLKSKIISEGEVFHFPPYSIHQEIAHEECEIIEVSNPIFNDRVKVESLFNEESQGGLPSTLIEDVVFS